MSHRTVAAVDLGSNSFHMLVARFADERLQVLDRLRERVALAEGLDDSRRLSEAAQERAIACLTRFGQRVRDMPIEKVRAVGTNTLRVAKNSRSFLARARRALGHPIEIISGHEEARLIHLGVAHALADAGGRRLVIDIGGGSTECVLGEGFDVRAAHSLYMGCIGHSRLHFPKGRIGPDRMARAVLAARVEMEHIENPYRELGWRECVGSSGTILAIDDILRRQGWSSDGITADGLGRLRNTMTSARKVKHLELAGLQPERAAVLPGGLAILAALFEGLSIERMRVSIGALREGVLYDLLGRLTHEDVRDRTIRELQGRHMVDAAHARRVELTALALRAQVASSWELTNDEQLLSWAARLHEMGLTVSYSGYQRHGAYLVENGDMPGFSREDQQALAVMVLAHRRKLRNRIFEALPDERTTTVRRLGLLLRLAVVLHRSRSTQPLPDVVASTTAAGLRLAFPPGWLHHHPLTHADLEQEAGNWTGVGLELVLG